ncbi:MAG: CPBP family intramembrane metalloprotease [Candidatus Dormibacteraeota bacterium]|nr:CPBP family intramembrane metalloprotease [Candidatus Dormibacteraeota bacterium]
MNGLRVDRQVRQESTSMPARIALVALCLVAAFSYRASVSLIPSGILEGAFLLSLAALFLAIALLLRRKGSLRRYWEIPFAFFVFTIAGFAADVNVSPVQRVFVQDVLREAPTANNPLASTVGGTVLVQLFSTLCIVVPIVVLIKASRSDLGSIFISSSRSWVVPVIGLVGLVGFYFLAARGRTAAFFPNSVITPSRFLALTPPLLVLVLLNGLREELWFRGLFLKRFEQFLGPWPSNLLTAVVFTSFHVQVQYALHLLPFLGFTLILGLFFGYLMQRSGSLLGPVLFHAGSDIPIFLAYLSYVST